MVWKVGHDLKERFTLHLKWIREEQMLSQKTTSYRWVFLTWDQCKNTNKLLGWVRVDMLNVDHIIYIYKQVEILWGHEGGNGGKRYKYFQ